MRVSNRERVGGRRPLIFKLILTLLVLATASGCQQAYERGQREGYASGRASGLEDGYSRGHSAGFAEGERAGHDKGLKEGYDKGQQEGFRDGHQRGLTEGHQQGFTEGHAQGQGEGYNSGYTDGSDGKPPAPYRPLEAPPALVTILLWVCFGLTAAGLSVAAVYLTFRVEGWQCRLPKVLVAPVAVYLYWRFVSPVLPVGNALSFGIAHTALLEVALLTSSLGLCVLFHRLFVEGERRLWLDCVGVTVAVLLLLQVAEAAFNGGLLLKLGDQTFALRLAAIPPVGALAYTSYAYVRRLSARGPALAPKFAG